MKLTTTITSLALAGVLLAGCGTVGAEKTTPPPNAPAAAGPASGTPEPTDSAQSDVAAIGEWAKSEDGVTFRVAKLARGRVSQYAAGGHPGDPAVIVTVQVKNGTGHRLDLTLLDVTARLGNDGREADDVYQDGFEGAPNGSLSRGRTSTSRYMFAADSAAELRHVSVDVAPGFDYDSFTFEGGV